MKMNKKVEEVLNKQINAEFSSAYLYLSMYAWFESKGLKGFANWMYVQYQEENTHALKICKFVLARAGKINLQPIASVATEWKGIMDVINITYNHELEVTAMIDKCHEVALAEKDNATASMLQWFIDEQTEEESNVLAIIDHVKLIGENGQAIYLLDKDLSTRVFVDPTQKV
jgi:ferritin